MIGHTSSSESVRSDGSQKSGGKFQKRERAWLTTTQFIFINLAGHSVLESYTSFADERSWTRDNFFQILAVYVFIGIPVGYLELVLGQYTHMGMFFMKHMVPIAQGMSFTYCMQCFATTVLHSLFMAQYFVYAVMSLTSGRAPMPWMTCRDDDDGGNEDECWSIMKGCSGPQPCINETRHLAAYVYWNDVYMKGVSTRETAKVVAPEKNRVAAVLICWFIIYGFMLFKLSKLKAIIEYGFMAFVIARILQLFFLLASGRHFRYISLALAVDIYAFVNTEAWLNALARVMKGMALGDYAYIMFGILSENGSKTGSLICVCSVFSYLLLMCDSLIVSCASFAICEKAKLPIDRRHLLFRPSSAQMEFGVVPTILGTLNLAGVWSFLHFLYRFSILLFRILLNNIFLQLSLFQKYEALISYTIYIKPLFCIVGSMVSLVLDTKEAFEIRRDIMQVVYHCCDHLNVLIITVLVIYVYGIAKFCDDVHFMTGEVPSLFWKVTWFLIPLVLLVSFPYYYLKMNDPYFVLRVTTITIVFSPYIVFLLVQFIKKTHQMKLFTMFKAEDLWGPAEPELKLLRRTFNPRQSTEYKGIAFKCQHKCLLNSRQLDAIAIGENLEIEALD